MSEVRFGYCCINLELSEKRIMTNRTMIKKTFTSKGKVYASELALKNVKDLVTICEWNVKNNMTLYRMSSSIFPWMSEYELTDLVDIKEIGEILLELGVYIKKNGLRVSFHPGPYNVLGSPRAEVVEKTLKELNQHAEIMDMMGLDESRQYPINIHCNGAYGDKTSTLIRWCNEFSKLSSAAKNRLVIENDDRASLYSVLDLSEGISKKVGVPVTFDYHHHGFNTGGQTEEESFKLAYSTWPYGITPLFHYSSSKKLHEDSSVKEQAHADYIYENIMTYGMDIDIDIEAKKKEKAVQQYLKMFVNESVAQV